LEKKLQFYFIFGERIDTKKKVKRNTHTHNWVAVKKLKIEKQNEVPKQSGGGGGGGKGGKFCLHVKTCNADEPPHADPVIYISLVF
jgi:hypothetical protein